MHRTLRTRNEENPFMQALKDLVIVLAKALTVGDHKFLHINQKVRTSFWTEEEETPGPITRMCINPSYNEGQKAQGRIFSFLYWSRD